MNNLMSLFENQYETPPPYISKEQLHPLLRQIFRLKYDSEAILEVVDRFFSRYQLNPVDFRSIRQDYSRTILLKEESGFEIMMARWDRGAITPIHGHPYYTFMYVIEGQLKEELFVKDEGRLLKIGDLKLTPGCYSYHKGERHRFDNAIHRITAEKNSLSLHIYSDDALKGEKYRAA